MIGLHMLNPLAAASSSSATGEAPMQLTKKQLLKMQQKQQQQQQQALYEHSHHQQANIMRIPAKTAPAIVGSVPKCRQTKGLRSHPMDTVNGSIVGRPLMSEQVRPVGRSASSGNDGKSNGHNRQLASDPAQVIMSAISNQVSDPDQRVLLIVNDDHIRGGGVPIIGRRLPSKSVALLPEGSRQLVQANYQVAASGQGAAYADYPEPAAAIRLDQAQAPIVVGRRSYRLLQQQQYEYHDGKQQQRHRQASSKAHHDHYNRQRLSSVAELGLASSKQQQHHLRAQNQMLPIPSGQQLQPMAQKQTTDALVAVGPPNRPIQQLQPPQSGSHGGRQKAKSSSSLALAKCPNGATAVMSECLPTGDHSQQQQVSRARRLDQAAAILGSSSLSCSSLCEQQQCLAGATIDCVCCCPPSCPGSPALAVETSSPMIATAATCQGACCLRFERQPSSTVSSGGCSLARSASCQRISTCCPIMNPKPTSSCHSRCSTHHERSHQHPTHHHHHQNGNNNNNKVHSQSHHNHSHKQYHNHQSCQANGSQATTDSNRSHTAAAAFRSSSSCHVGRQHQQQLERPLLMKGQRNVLPVAPKPIVNYNKRPPLEADAYEDDEATDSVTQMYESLAAELKAKLGNPKLGPILLPPKDYDTMSRKQGKLSGIELRRSTNPQLVGPTASRAVASGVVASGTTIRDEPTTTTKQPTRSLVDRIHVTPPTAGADNEIARQRHQAVNNGGCGGSSTRSSCRSQDDGSGSSTSVCLERSRSNSSSGLGSISLGAGSPSSSASSKCSSSEDMRALRRSTAAAASAAGGEVSSNSNASSPTTNGNHLTKVQFDSRGGDSVATTGGQLLRVKRQQQHGQIVASGAGDSLQVGGRKNCSPDNCAGSGSDSGHSGSGRLDSVGGLSNEEQRIMLRDTSDFYSASPEPKLTSNGQKNAAIGSGNSRRVQAKATSSPIGSGGYGGQRGKGIEAHNPAKVSDGVLWNGRVEIPLKINSDRDGNTYLATKQIIY